jgi:hypothetical protein
MDWDWVQLLGYAASSCVFVTFCMRGMLPLRVVALGSNVLFGLYGFFGHIYPVLFLHVLLLPINAFRLMQVREASMYCLSCGTQNEPARKFCGECGAMMRQDAAAIPQPVATEQREHGRSAIPAVATVAFETAHVVRLRPSPHRFSSDSAAA